MAKKIIKAQMKQRIDTKANWASKNPVLLLGELGMVSDDPNLYKVGDGVTAWNALPFRGFDGTLAQEPGTSESAAMSQKAVTEAAAVWVTGGTRHLLAGLDYNELDGDFNGVGNIGYLDNYWHSSPILLLAGETIYTKRQYRGNTWAFVQVTEAGEWVKGLVNVGQTLEHSYTAAEDMYISVTNTKADSTTYRPLESAYMTVNSIKSELLRRINGVKDELAQFSGAKDLVKDRDYQIIQGAININGIVNNSDSAYWYSTPIAVKRGDVVHMTTQYKGSGMAIGRTNADGEYYAPITGHDNTKTYSVYINFDGYIAICYIKDQFPTEFYIESSVMAREKGQAEAYSDLMQALSDCAEENTRPLTIEHETQYTNLLIQARFERGKMLAELETLTEDDILAQGSCGYSETAGSITDGTIQWKIYKGGLLHITGHGKMYDFVKGTEATKTIQQVNEQVTKLGGEFWYYGFVNENVNGITPPFGQTNQKYSTDEIMHYENKRYVPFGEQINPLNDKPYGYSAPWYIYRTHVDDNYTPFSNYMDKNPRQITYNRVLIEEDKSKGGITYIGNWAFYRVSANSLILPESVSKIGCWGIRYSPVIRTVIMGDNITTIEDHGLSRMEALEAVKISQALSSIGYSGMDSDAQLKMVEFPEATTSMGSFCFNGCGSLQIARFGGLTNIPQNFATNAALNAANIPAGATTIGANSFYKNPIRKLIIPESVTEIKSGAFRFVDEKITVIKSQTIIDNFEIKGATATTLLLQGAILGRCDYLLIPLGLNATPAIEKFFLYKGSDDTYQYYKRDCLKLDLN